MNCTYWPIGSTILSDDRRLGRGAATAASLTAGQPSADHQRRASGAESVASLRSVTCRLGRALAVRNVSLEVFPGESVAVLGPNGSGKTTLLKTMAGLIAPTAGTVVVGGTKIGRSHVAARGIVGYAGHHPHHYNDLTVSENLAFVGDIFLVDDPIPRIERLTLDLGIGSYRESRARELSRGLQQRLALAIALLPSPRLLLLDEPEAALDAATREKLKWIFDTYAGDAGIIFATHDLAGASELADRAVVLNRGVLAGEFTVQQDDPDALPGHVAAALDSPTRIRPSAAIGTENRSNGRAPATAVWSARRVDTLKQMAVVFRNDIRLELRTREFIPALTVLSLLMVIAFSLAFVVPAEDVPAVAAGVFWASLIFGTLVGGSRSFRAERDEGTMEALVLSPVLRAAIYLAKASVNFIFLTVVGLLTLVSVAVLFDVGLIRWEMFGLLLLGAAAFSSTGSLYGAVTTNMRARELLIPVLLLPVALPILIAGVAATLAILDATSNASQLPWFGLLAGFCAIFASMGAILFDYVLGE